MPDAKKQGIDLSKFPDIIRSDRYYVTKGLISLGYGVYITECVVDNANTFYEVWTSHKLDDGKIIHSLQATFSSWRHMFHFLDSNRVRGTTDDLPF